MPTWSNTGARLPWLGGAERRRDLAGEELDGPEVGRRAGGDQEVLDAHLLVRQQPLDQLVALRRALERPARNDLLSDRPRIAADGLAMALEHVELVAVLGRV